MKKLIAIVLMLCIAAFTFTAMAETRTYVFLEAEDLDGNKIELAEEDMPDWTLTIDDESMTFVFTAENVETTGTVEMTAQEDEDGIYYILTLTDEDGTAQECLYVMDDAAGYDYVVMIDENDVAYFMINAEAAEE